MRAAKVIRGLARGFCDMRVYALRGRRSDYKKHVGSSFHDIPPGISEYLYRGLLRGIAQAACLRLQIALLWQPILDRLASGEPHRRRQMCWADTMVINHSYVYTFFSPANFAFNSITRSSRTNVKTFEDIAAFLPLLSTSFGTRDFHLQDGEDFFLSTTTSLQFVLEDKICTKSPPNDRHSQHDLFSKNLSVWNMEMISRK